MSEVRGLASRWRHELESPFPAPDFPNPASRFPIPDSRFPIPDIIPFPAPELQNTHNGHSLLCLESPWFQ